MITSLQLTNRVWQFFDVIYGANKIDYGFNADSNFAFIEDNQDNAIRPGEKTILFFKISSPEKIGNAISSDTQIYNRINNKEEILAFRKVSVVINIISKDKGSAKDAMNALMTFLQSTRKQSACYGDPFSLVLVNADPSQDLSELEEGAWSERMQRTLYFRYNDLIEIGDAEFTQVPAVLEDTKGIINYTIDLK